MKERVHNFFVKRAIVFLIVAALLAIGLFIYRTVKTSQIDSFAECAAAGNPIMESYPEQCRANGQTFVNR